MSENSFLDIKYNDDFGNIHFLKILISAAALLLPYVFIEPAPVDIVLFAITIFCILKINVPAVALFIYLAYLVFTLLSAVLGLMFETARYDVASNYLMIEFYLATSMLAITALCNRGDDFVPLFLRWYVIGAVISAIIILLIKFGPDNVSLIYRDEWRVRLRGFFKDPNVLAPYLILPIVAMYFSPATLKLEGWRIVALSSCLLLLILTFSRGGYVALAVSIFFGVALKASVDLSIKTLFLSGVFLASAFASLLWLSSNGYFAQTEYLLSRFELKEYDDGRFFHILHALEIGFSNPFGLGPGGYGSYTSSIRIIYLRES